MTKTQYIDLDFKLTPKQAEVFKSSANEIFYGGGVGGGKSYLLRLLAIYLACRIPNLQIYLFRRTRPDLIKTHVEGPKGIRSLLAEYIKSGLVELVEDECRFTFNGSKIYFCHLKDEDDKNNYLSTEIHVLLFDELTTFTETMYTFLRTRVRGTGLDLPDEFKGTIPKIISTSNPAGIGHNWVKRMFIDDAVPLEVRQMPDEDGGMKRQFVPALLIDNPFLLTEDPNYAARVKGMGSPALVKAYLEGDWSIVQGQYFSEFCGKHQIRPFSIPHHWTKMMGLDWGSKRPFYVGWFAVASEECTVQTRDGESITIPVGSLVQYREWNGERSGKDGYNVGLRLTVEQLAEGILEREPEGERIDYRIADTSMFEEDGGPSQIERMQSYTNYKLFFMKSDKRRKPGWEAVRSRLVGLHDKPLIYFFWTCLAIIRDLPAMQHSEKDPEDCESDGVADHSVDQLRYVCMSRPWTNDTPLKPIDKPIGLRGLTLEGLYAMHKSEKSKSRRYR